MYKEIKVNKKDNLLYKLACEYMAKTELYDRWLPHTDGRYDKTESWVYAPFVPLSNMYANKVRKEIIEKYNIPWSFIHNEIKKYNYYTAQKWINEYEYLKGR